MIEILEKENVTIEENNLLNSKNESIGDTLLKKLNLENDYDDFLVLILKVKYAKDYSKFNMFGLNAINYITSSVNMCETKIVEYNKEEDIIKTIKQNLNDKKYVAVVFSDTPLLRRYTFLEILDYFKYKSLCALKFNRGYVFETKYLKSVDKVYNPQVQNFNEEDFIKVVDEKTFNIALETLKNRILNYHMSRGVIIKDLNTTFIDAEVNIDDKVILENNINLQGKTVIKEGSTIGVNSTIKNAIIENNCFIENSILENVLLKQNVKITDFSVVKNVVIEENKEIVGEKIIRRD